MTLFTSRTMRLAALTAVATVCQLSNASAQVPKPTAPSSLLDVKTTVATGEVVQVTDTGGHTIKGLLVAITSDAIALTVQGETRTVTAGQVQQIRWQQRDSWLTGAVIGAGIGAIPGIYYLVTDPNECTGLCPEDYAAIGVGALVGGLVDRAITKKVTVYERPPAGVAGWTMVVRPVLTRARKSVQVAVRF